MITKSLQKFKQLFLNTSIKKNTKSVTIDYQDKLIKSLYSDCGIIKKDNLENYINSKFKKEIYFARVVSIYGKIYQNDFSSLLYSLFYNYENTIHKLKIKTTADTIECVNIYIKNLYECYKDYLINYIQFYIDNPGFSYALNCYPQSMLSDPFYEYVSEYPILSHYNRETRNILYLKLIEKIVFARFLGLKEETLIAFRNNLTKFTKSKNKEIVKISKRTRDKLYKYNGVKCPENLIYISLISAEKAKILSKYIINRFFEENTDINALKLAFQARLSIILANNKSLAEHYVSNPYFSYPLVIKKTKLGYISYIYDYLIENDYIVQDYNKIWDSIAKKKYFQYRKKNDSIEFVSPNKFSQSLGYKKQRLNPNKTEDKELNQLIGFLNANFKLRDKKTNK